MRRRIVLHGGLHKTGTTAVQQLLRGNRELLLQHDIYIPPPSKRYGSWAGGLHRIPRDLNDGATPADRLQTLHALLKEFDDSGCGTLFLSAEKLSLLPRARLEELAEALAGYEIAAALCFRHPIRHAQSRACNKDVPKNSQPDGFLRRQHSNRYPYGDIACSWRAVFGSTTRLYRYEKYATSLEPILEILDLALSSSDLSKSGDRIRRSMLPETVFVNTKLRGIFPSLDGPTYRTRVYNNLLDFEGNDEYSDIIAQYGAASAVFPLATQKAYLTEQADQLEALNDVLEVPGCNYPEYTSPIEGTLPDAACVDRLTESFLIRHLPEKHFDYVKG